MDAEAINNRPQIEIEHYPKFDLMLNNSQSTISQREFNELQNVLSADFSTTLDDRPNSWKKTNISRIFEKEISGIEFVMKRKELKKGDALLESAIQASPGEIIEGTILDKKSLLLKNIVLSEMYLTPTIKKVLGSENVREACKEAGIDSIDFIEPIAAVIEHSSGNKYLVYKKIKEQKMRQLIGDDETKTTKISDLIDKITGIFLENSIKPVDFDTRQLLAENVDGKIRLHLIDTEMYQSLNPK